MMKYYDREMKATASAVLILPAALRVAQAGLRTCKICVVWRHSRKMRGKQLLRLRLELMHASEPHATEPVVPLPPAFRGVVR